MTRMNLLGNTARTAVLALTFLLAVAGCKADDGPPDPAESLLLRSTAQGTVRGVVWDENTLAWLGIPYAAPPEGQRRWRAPRPPDPWTGVRDAGSFSGPCSQLGGFLGRLDPATFGTPIGSEDCLYLNVWQPRTAERGLPVFFYIHGGMNSVGEAATCSGPVT